MGAPLTDEQLQARKLERKRKRRFQEQKRKLLRLVRRNFLEELQRERRRSPTSAQQRSHNRGKSFEAMAFPCFVLAISFISKGSLEIS